MSKTSRVFLAMIFGTSLFASATAQANAFCEGWNVGYKNGYCYQKFGCLPPIPPLCPLPGIGENDFQDGYNRGFAAGLADRR